MGVAVTSEARVWDQDAGRRASGIGVGVYQHAHFGQKFGTDVGLLFSTGVDGHGHHRTDLAFTMPGLALRIPVEGKLQPYASTALVMTASFYSGPNGEGTIPFMFVGNRTALGLEWRTAKDQSWFFEVATTLRGRFSVEKNDKDTLASHPDYARETALVHEVSFALGTAIFVL